MTRSAGTLALGLAVLLGPACGKKGPLQLPLVREPQAAAGLSAFQRGDKIILEWVNPSKYLDGRPLPGLAAVEIWVRDRTAGAAGTPATSEDFESSARLARRIVKDEFASVMKPTAGRNEAWSCALPLPRVGRSSSDYAVRLFDPKEHPSKFCVPVRIDVQTCPMPPRLRHVQTFKDFIEVRWAAPEANLDGSKPAVVRGYCVYRSAEGKPPEKLTVVPDSDLRYEDRNFEFGLSYIYTVRACADSTGQPLESDDSNAGLVTPRDTFPPDPPSGVVALAGQNVISLSWEAGREGDLDGYRIWRKEAGADAFSELRPSPIRENMFTDAAVEKGKIYFYAVSSRDRSGNESPRSETGPVSLKRSGP